MNNNVNNEINSEKIIDEIINNFNEKNNMMLYSFVGPNGSGKTTFLNNLKKRLENNKYNVFYLNNEILISNELKENKSQQEFKAQLRKFLNKYFLEEANVEESTDFVLKRKKIQKQLSIIKESKYKFKHFKNEFLNLFTLDEGILKGIVKIEIINNEWNFKSFSSGEGIFSLLCLMKIILETAKINNEDKIILIIDEPEKFLHDSLIKKISNFFYELCKLNVYIFFSTHSSYLINELVINFKNEMKEFNVIKIISPKKYLSVTNSLFDSELNSRELNIIVKSLFDDYVILVEGLNDYEFANLLCINEFNNYFFNIYDCHGKNNVGKMCSKISTFNKNVFSFFDKDYKSKKEGESIKKSDSFRENYINKKYQYYEFDDNIEDFFDNKICKKEFSQKITIKQILDNHKTNIVLEILRKFFMGGDQND